MTDQHRGTEIVSSSDPLMPIEMDVTALNEDHLTADQGIVHRLSEVAGSVGTDYRNSENRTRTVSLGLLALGTQVADRARVAVILVPTVSIDVLKHSHSATEAAIAGGGLFAAWCLTVGGTLTEGLSEYPNAVRTFENNFPGFTSVLEDSLPGLYSDNETNIIDDLESRSRTSRIIGASGRIGKTALTHIKRGATAIGIGNTAYVAVASARGQETKEIHKLSAKTGIDGGIIAGLIVGVVSESIVKLGESNPQLAIHIQNVSSNKYLWYGVAGALMLSNLVSTRLSRKKEEKQSQLLMQNPNMQENKV
jgi:hypothetical protein